MRVIFSGGGTGGHIYPIMALVKRLKERKLITNDEALFVGTDRGLESKIVPAAGVPFRALEIKGFDCRHPLKSFETTELSIKATKEAKQIIKDFKPDVIVGTGGYASGTIVYEAAKMYVPTIIHKFNSVVGLANKFLAHYVDKVCYTFDDAAKQFSERKKLVKAGNPRSQQVLGLNKENVDIAKEWDLNPNIPTVLISGGSRGALAINQIVEKSLPELETKPYQAIWATGQLYYGDAKKKLAGKKISSNVRIIPYIDNVPGLLPQMTCVIAGSGATSLTESTALGVPVILIPSPNVTHNHQMKNAMDMEKVGAALVIAEDDLNPNNFVLPIDHILLNTNYAKQMSEASKRLDAPDVSDQVILVMEGLIKNK